MELRDRKAIANKSLPKFDLGLSIAPSSVLPNLQEMNSLSNNMLNSGNFVKNSTGGLEPNMLKNVNGAGSFLKNNASGIMNIGSSLLDFGSTLSSISKNKMTSDQMMGSGGQSNELANGVSYQESKVDSGNIQNQIDATAKAGTMQMASKGAALGGAVGSVIPGVGTVVGGAVGGIVGGIAGLFGSRKAKREAERLLRIARERTRFQNVNNMERAYTTGLRNEFNRENITDTSQSLFHAEEGVEGSINPLTGATYKKHNVNTAYGKIKAPLNAWVSRGEVIRSKDGSLYRVKEGPNDTARAYLQDGDSVYSKKIINPETGNSIADDAASYAMAGQLDRLDMNLNVGRMMKEAGKRKGNILPGYLGGTANKFVLGDDTDTKIGNTTFAGRPGSFVDNTWTGTQYGGGFDALEGLPALNIFGRRIIDTMQHARRPFGSQIDTMPGSRSPQSAAGPIGQISFGDAPLGVRARGKNSAIDTMPISSVADRGSEVVSQMQIPGSEGRIKSNAGTDGNGKGGAKKPGLFSKIKGAIGNLGNNLDLGNLSLLANAYMTAAQRDARAEGLRAPKSFAANPYEQDSLQQLNSLHSDYYPVWAQNRELEGRGKSSIAQSGGLSAGQKMLGYMGLANQTQQNNMAALFEHQGRENALRSQAAKAALEAGNQSATRQQQAYQWDEDMLAKAHAAQENMLETSDYDRQNAFGQFFKNKWDRDQYNRTMNLYESQQKDDHAKTQAIIENLRNNKPSETPEPAKTPIKAAEDAVAAAQKSDKQIVQPEAKWDGQLLSRKRKSSGENVKTLLRNLVKALGQDKINAIMKKRGVKTWDDGKFGGATEEALMEFQKSQGWKTRKEGLDGILGGDTFKALQAAIKGK